MSSYIKSLRDQDGYISLRDKHYEDINAFPALGDNVNDFRQNPDTVDEEDQAGNDQDDETTHSETSANPTPKEAEVALIDEMADKDDRDIPPTKRDDLVGDSTPDNPPMETHQTLPELDDLDKPKEKVDKEVKETVEPEEQVKKDLNKAPPKETEGRVRGASVSLLRLPSKLSATPPSPNQTPAPASSSSSRSMSPAPGQSLGLLERPLVKHITEGISYNEEQLRRYTIQAIVQKEITFKSVRGEEEKSPVIGKSVLKGTKEGSPMNNKKKARLSKLEDRIKEMSKKATTWEAVREIEEGKKRGRLTSQTEMSEEESLPKTVRVVSPKIT